MNQKNKNKHAHTTAISFKNRALRIYKIINTKRRHAKSKCKKNNNVAPCKTHTHAQQIGDKSNVAKHDITGLKTIQSRISKPHHANPNTN